MFSPELRHFRYMDALARELHFGRAAARVGIAQPPFSQQIQQLERQLGLVLVERRPVVALTPAGEAFVETGRRLMSQLADGLEATRRIGSGESGSLRIGFAASTLMTGLTAALNAFRKTHPGVTLDLRELSTAQQIEALSRGELDLGVMREVQSDRADVVSEALVLEPLIAVLPEDHRLADRSHIQLEELRDDPFVLFPMKVAPDLYRRVAGLFLDSRVTPNVVMEALEWITIVGLVEAGVGVSIVPGSFERLKLGRAVYVRLQSDTAVTQISLCLPRTAVSPSALNFADILRTTLGARPSPTAN